MEGGDAEAAGKDNINRFQNHMIAEGVVDTEENEGGGDLPTPLGPPPSSPPSSSSSSTLSSPSSSLSPLSPPTAAVHLVPCSSKCGLAPHVYLAPREEAGIERTAVWGINSSARNNLCWQPDSGEVKHDVKGEVHTYRPQQIVDNFFFESLVFT